MRAYHHILLLLMLVLFKTPNFAQEHNVVHSIGVNVRPSYVMPTHGFYNGFNSMGKALRFSESAHLNYAFQLSPESYQGIGLGLQSFFAHELIGTPVSVYLFQGAPVVTLSDKITLDYEWNFGLSAGWKGDELLMGSSCNVYINVGLFAKWRISPAWDLILGPEYTHYSNGDTSFPNSGANTVNLRLGVRGYINRPEDYKPTPQIFKFEKSEFPFAQHLTYDLTVFGAWRADRMLVNGHLNIIDKAFPIAGIQVNPLYHFNKHLSAGASLDLIYDRSANLIASVDENKQLSYIYPSFLRQTAAGVSVRGELKMPVFAVNIGAGYNFTDAGSDLRGLYGVFALKTFLTDSLFLNVGYRLGTVLYAHNLMFGLGWRFGSY